MVKQIQPYAQLHKRLHFKHIAVYTPIAQTSAKPDTQFVILKKILIYLYSVRVV